MKMKGIYLTKYFNVLFLIMIFASTLLFVDPTVDVVQLSTVAPSDRESLTVVIDAGHGGRDPGKVGINNALEKDINLSIALKLKDLLEQNDIHVIMIRENDNGLYSESDSNKKVADMRKRVEIINSSKAVLAISIHQNSFTQESSKGAQVFYYPGSAEGKVFANIMQEQLKKSLKDGNKRVSKANDSYYMLKKTECPIVIVECGYLSNYEEAALLIDDTYQGKMAWAIHLGVLSYMNQDTKNISSVEIR